jgi:hypothetical protein
MTAAACKRTIRQGLAADLRIIVDNTNRSRKTRAELIAIARSFHAPVRCVYFPTDKALSFHLDALRLDHPDPAGRKHKRLPAVAIHSFHANVEPPGTDEGFVMYVVPFGFDAKITPVAHFRKWHH